MKTRKPNSLDLDTSWLIHVQKVPLARSACFPQIPLGARKRVHSYGPSR